MPPALSFSVPHKMYDSVLGDKGEIIVFTTLSLILGCTLIIFIWNMLFYIAKKRRIVPFLLIGAAFLISIVVFPANFSMYEADNLLTYSYAIRNIADYWQSIYMGVLYSGCLLVIPNPVVITCIQLSAWFGAVYYIAHRSCRAFGKWQGRLVWLIAISPEFWEVGINAYRNCVNTIFCVWFYGILFLDCVERKKRSKKELIILSFTAGFLSVFRSEGILTVLVLVVAIIYIYGCEIKKSIAYFVICCLSFGIFFVPQKIGSDKYYGNEYSIINEMNILKDVFSTNGTNLAYKGVEDDLNTISQFIPLESLAVYGMEGYRTNNYLLNGSLNQSGKTKDEQKLFMKAAGNILLHNKSTFLLNRLVVFAESNGASVHEQKEVVSDIWNVIYESHMQDYYTCADEVIGDAFPTVYFSKVQRITWSNLIVEMIQKYESILNRLNLILVSRILVFALFVALVLHQRKEQQKSEKRFWFFTMLLLYGQLFIVFCACPEARSEYYFPSYFVMLLGSYLLLFNNKVVEKNRNAI